MEIIRPPGYADYFHAICPVPFAFGSFATIQELPFSNGTTYPYPADNNGVTIVSNSRVRLAPNSTWMGWVSYGGSSAAWAAATSVIMDFKNFANAVVGGHRPYQSEIASTRAAQMYSSFIFTTDATGEFMIGLFNGGVTHNCTYIEIKMKRVS